MRCTNFFLRILAGILAFCSAGAQPLQPPLVIHPDKTATATISTADRIIAVGTAFLDLPYAYNTLDTAKEERLVVNLKAFDCVTFVETVLARVLTPDATDTTLFCYHLQECRYRDGIIDGYASRLHYFSDWLYEQEWQGRLQILTNSTNGILLPKPVNFMSVHRKSYPRLREDAAFNAILQVEKHINERPIYYIPKNEIGTIEKTIREGDIIAITTNKKGLDISHCGFAIRQGDEIHLLHASSEYHRVMITAEPLTVYLQKNKSQTGVIVGRVKSYK